MKRTKPPGSKREKNILILPEEMTGRELKSWARKTKTPLFKRKMRRTKFTKTDQKKIRSSLVPRRLTRVSLYLKNSPELKRTKFKT